MIDEMTRAVEYAERQEEIAGWRINIVSYRIADRYYCTIDNVDPGARFARADGISRVEAERQALEKARKYLSQTRRFLPS